MKTIIKIALPILIIVLAVGAYRWQMNNVPEPKKKAKQRMVPIVRFAPAQQIDGYRYQVSGYGTVEPAKKLEIVSEVAGKIIWVSENMKAGGLFKKNEWLYKIDDIDYKAALDAKMSALKSAEFSLQKVVEEADVSKKEWEIWSEASDIIKKPSKLVSYEPQLESAKAAVKSAESAVEIAESNLSKVRYKAPFDAVVTAESVEIGKVIRTGEPAGTLIGTESFEVYLPMSAKDAVRITFSSDRQKASEGYIELAEGKDSWRWNAFAERVLPDADSKTGMLQAVLVVPEPFDTINKTRPLLPLGASVKAVIKDRDTSDVVRIPDEALREGGVVWVIFNDNTVQIREVKIAEKRGDFIYLNSGISAGEKVITSNLNGVVDGMTVSTGVKTGGDK